MGAGLAREKCLSGMGLASGKGETFVIACDKREAFAQGSISDEAIHLEALRSAEEWIASLALAMTGCG